MTVARHYVMIAAEGKESDLLAALDGLADAVRPLPGCEGVDLMQDGDAPTRFVFIEKWASIGAHKEAGALLPKSALAPVMGALAGPPEGGYLHYIKTV
jgi:quinol monooxygenase YgiN